METNLKYFSKTIAALAELKASAALLEENASSSIAENKELNQKLKILRQQIAEKATRIEKVIQTLNGAAK